MMRLPTKSELMSVSGTSGFPDPFLDLASMSMPQAMPLILYWAEHLFQRFGVYRMAMDRVASYFVDEVLISGVSYEEQEKWLKILEDPLNFSSVLKDVLTDRLCYGNGFCSMIVPFKRLLFCRKCSGVHAKNVEQKQGLGWTLKEVATNDVFGFDFQCPNFVATCPRCKHRGNLLVHELSGDVIRGLKFKRWSPHQIHIVSTIFNTCTYFWKIPEKDRQNILRSGRRNYLYLDDVPQVILECVAANKPFQFAPGYLFHMREAAPAGVVTGGWGLPRAIVNWRQMLHVQVLRRANESIALDYVIPLRVITPAPRGQAGGGGMAGIAMHDAMAMASGEDMQRFLARALERRRFDPTMWSFLPIPVQYHLLGGDANALSTPDLQNQALETFLNEIGAPVDFFKGSLQLQAAPLSLRLFESTWAHLYNEANKFLRWTCDLISRFTSWRPVRASLRRNSITEDLQRQAIAVQLMMNQQLSGSTLFHMMRLGDWKQEQQRIAEEAAEQLRIQARMQELTQQAGFAQQLAKGMVPGQPPAGPGAPAGGAATGAAPPGGDPAAAGATAGTSYALPVSRYLASLPPNAPISPVDLIGAAQSLAAELSMLPESVKDSQLRELGKTNSLLHSQVLKELNNIREQNRRAAYAAASGVPPM